MNTAWDRGPVQRIAWALMWIFVFAIPSEKSVMLPGFGTLARLLGMAAFAVGALAAWRRRALRPPNLALAAAAVFVVWSAATWLWSLDRHATFIRAGTLAELLAMMWLIWESCRGPVRQAQLMAAYVCGAVAASGLAFARYAAHVQTYYRRYAAGGFDPNDFGVVLALSIPVALYLALETRGWRSWAYRAAAVVVILAIFLTASRTALIATFAAFGFAVWTWRRANWAQRLTTAGLAILLLSSVVHFGPSQQRTRLATIPHEMTRGTFHDRTRIWKSGIKAFRAQKQRMLVGVGAGAFPEAVVPWLGRPTVPDFQFVAHNTFLSVLVETGLTGFAAYALMLGVLAVFIWTMEAPGRALWAVTMLVWAVGVSTLTWEHYKPGWLVMALIQTDWARSFWRGEAR